MPRRAGDLVRMGAAAVGEDELAAGERGDGAPKARVRLDGGMVDVVDVFQEIVGRDAVFDHQAAQRRAVATVVILLEEARVFQRKIEKAPDKFLDAGIDLLEQRDVARIERVVEIEHPRIDVGEAGEIVRARDGRAGRGDGVHGLMSVPAPWSV